MITITQTKPTNARSLKGLSGATYDRLTELQLRQAEYRSMWIVLGMQGNNDDTFAIGDIGSIRREKTGGATWSFTCCDVRGVKYYGTITDNYTTFGPAV